MASSQSSQNVELEAAKFLHKLIQDSKDEPAKLATKLYVVCSLRSNKISFFLLCLNCGGNYVHTYYMCVF
jgi:hypothetical protein